MAFCLCMDMDGFRVKGKFIIREIGWYAPLPDGGEDYGIQYFTHDYTWDQLDKKDQKTVAYVKRHVTGLTFRPSPREYTLSNNNVLPQDQVPSFVHNLWKHYKTPECNTVAYKGGTLEFILLTLLVIPNMDLEQQGCPTYKKLKPYFSHVPHCQCHISNELHCAMAECYVFSKWYFLNKS